MFKWQLSCRRFFPKVLCFFLWTRKLVKRKRLKNKSRQPCLFCNLMERMQPVPRDSKDNGVAAMLVYHNKGANEKPFVQGNPTWRRWRHVHLPHGYLRHAIQFRSQGLRKQKSGTLQCKHGYFPARRSRRWVGKFLALMVYIQTPSRSFVFCSLKSFDKGMTLFVERHCHTFQLSTRKSSNSVNRKINHSCVHAKRLKP